MLLFAAMPLAAQTEGEPPRTVWDGLYSPAQATRGGQSYADFCAECHGPELEGGRGDPLAGERFWNSWREDNVRNLYGYLRDNMPNFEPGSLADATYLDIVAFLLQRNGLPAGPSELTEAGSNARIVAAEGPGELPDSTFVHVVGCLVSGSGQTWQLSSASDPVRTQQLIAAVGTGDEVRLGEREFTLRFVFEPLEKFLGHRMSVTGLLLGVGGKDGLNVTSIEAVAETCSP